jgi:hypothetical protein
MASQSPTKTIFYIFMLFFDCGFIRRLLFKGRLQFAFKQQSPHNILHSCKILMKIHGCGSNFDQKLIKENSTYSATHQKAKCNSEAPEYE